MFVEIGEAVIGTEDCARARRTVLPEQTLGVARHVLDRVRQHRGFAEHHER